MLTPYRVVFIVLAVGLSANLWLVLTNYPDKPDSSAPIEAISQPFESPLPTQAEQISRETIAQRAYNGALHYCDTQQLNSVAPDECSEYVKQHRTRCFAKIVPTMPVYFEDLDQAVIFGDRIIGCLLPASALPQPNQPAE